MRTALPIPAFARGRSKPAPPVDLAPTLSEAIDRLGRHRQFPYHFAIGRTADKLDWLFAAHPNAKIALVTTIPPAPDWHDIEA